ncbi:MAG TPA: SDR family NAD(P)-dependent oxidoreductase [Chthoniobacterales bacterium]|nr:SDR family NAD(P)-dependent oxidoreductase [Chthoniobacterales bacterium]
MKKIFLTGASSGIGLATAKLLTARGHEVWGTSRDSSRLPSLSHFHPIQLDLTVPDLIEEAWNAALKEAVAFDVVINNAGAGHFNPAEFVSSAIIRAQFELLVFGHVQLCQLALRSMQTQPSGLIINVTSLASRLPVPFTAAYNAAKAAMASFTMTMQLELGDSPIRLVDLQPGDICTEFNDAVEKDKTRDSRYEQRMKRAWDVINKNMSNAPKPELVAKRIARLITETNPPPRVTVGDPFQSVIAPAIFALLPPRVRVWGLRRYYGI